MSTEDTESYPQVAGYSESFKMTVVAEVVNGQISQRSARIKYGIGGKCTISKWIKKYGTNKEIKKITKVRMPNDKLKIKELKTRIHQLEHLVSDLQLEKRVLDKLIEIAEREYKISIKKNTGLRQLKNSKENAEE